jgi:hypothetical protein
MEQLLRINNQQLSYLQAGQLITHQLTRPQEDQRHPQITTIQRILHHPLEITLHTTRLSECLELAQQRSRRTSTPWIQPHKITTNHPTGSHHHHPHLPLQFRQIPTLTIRVTNHTQPSSTPRTSHRPTTTQRNTLTSTQYQRIHSSHQGHTHQETSHGTTQQIHLQNAIQNGRTHPLQPRSHPTRCTQTQIHTFPQISRQKLLVG